MLITNVVTADCDEIRRLFLDEIGTARSRREHQRASLKKVVGQRHVEPFD